MSQLPARIVSSELMPPEVHYQPFRIPGPRIIGFISWIGLVISLSFLILTPGFALLALIPLAPSLFLLWRMRRGILRANEENQRGIHLLAAGDFDAAGGVFENLAENRWSWGHGIFVFNRGVVFRMAGRPQRALSLFNAVESSGRMTSKELRPLAPQLLAETALCHAVVGNYDQAREYVERARMRLPHHGDGRLLLIEAIVLIRTGRVEEALDEIDSRWRYADGALTGSSLKALRLLKAFALAKAGRSNEREFRLMLDGIYPYRTQEFVWLTATWPEMEAFVAQQLA